MQPNSFELAKTPPHIHLHHLHYATANGTCMPRSKNPTRESCVCAQATFDGDTKSNPICALPRKAICRQRIQYALV